MIWTCAVISEIMPVDLDERHRRFLHGAKVHEEWEGVAHEYKEAKV